jgi:colicin import membrane protein
MRRSILSMRHVVVPNTKKAFLTGWTLLKERPMNTQMATLLVAVGMMASIGTPVMAANNEADLKAMEAAAERVKQGGAEFKEELKRIREERKLKEAREAEARRQAAERARQEAARQAAAEAAAKREKERLAALEAAQEKARREAEARAAAKAERERLAALAAQREKEEKKAKALAALAKMKAQGSTVGYESTQPAQQQAQQKPPQRKLTEQEKAIKAMQALRAQTGPKAYE